jgi:hypothetical protein
MVGGGEWAVGAQPGRHGSVRAGAMMLDAACEPELNFGFNPTDGTKADAYTSWESAFGLELVNHRASEAGDFADLGETENLYGRCSSSGLSGHGCDPNVWFR